MGYGLLAMRFAGYALRPSCASPDGGSALREAVGTDATLARKLKRFQAMLLVKGVILTRALFVPSHPPTFPNALLPSQIKFVSR